MRHTLDWSQLPGEEPSVEFNLGVADWFALFRRTGFEVEDYLELRNPDPDRPASCGIAARWAHDHPSEQVWKLRRRG